MEFREFSNPEGADYDLRVGEEEQTTYPEENPYVEQLLGMIGILEDVTDEEVMEQYGITMDEYFSPTAETIEKVKEKRGKVR